MTGNEQDAEDVVQESFIRAYRQLGRFEARAHFATWLHRIVANCSVDLMRVATIPATTTRSTDDLDAVVEQPQADVAGSGAARAERADRAIRGCGDVASSRPLERAAFTLRHYEGRSIAEIGKTLGLGTSATKHSVFRAVRKLRAALGPIAG